MRSQLPNTTAVLRRMLAEIAELEALLDGDLRVDNLKSQTCVLAWIRSFRCWFERDFGRPLWSLRVYGKPQPPVFQTYLSTVRALSKAMRCVQDFPEEYLGSAVFDVVMPGEQPSLFIT
jgi:hypothetical protein